MNDLWKFDGENWVWISGSNATSKHGNYGEKGQVASTNVPGARTSSCTWIDSSNNLFGGFGFDESTYGIIP